MRVRILNIPLQVRGQRGFTIVELLIVIVIMGILAAITIVAYNGIEGRAKAAKYQSDLNKLEKAIVLARNTTSQTLIGITGSTYTASGCVSKPAGTDLATVSKTDGCWTLYFASLSKIAAASGMSVSGLIDPWGRPYYIDENEGEGGTGCIHDHIAAYDLPSGGSVYADSSIFIPNSGNSGCAA